MAAALVVVLAAGGAVFAFVRAGGRRPPATGRAPGLSDRSRAASDAARSAAPMPGRGLPAGGTGAAGPTVAMGAMARARPHAAAADAFLASYFTAINHHDYRAYLHLFSPDSRRGLSVAGFQDGYGTTRDLAERLQALTAAGPGQLAATVAFTSHQSPASSPAHATCLRWRITVYLVGRGGRYVIGNPPAGYYATYRSC
jgi:hypothetical protein